MQDKSLKDQGQKKEKVFCCLSWLYEINRHNFFLCFVSFVNCVIYSQFIDTADQHLSGKSMNLSSTDYPCLQVLCHGYILPTHRRQFWDLCSIHGQVFQVSHVLSCISSQFIKFLASKESPEVKRCFYVIAGDESPLFQLYVKKVVLLCPWIYFPLSPSL